MWGGVNASNDDEAVVRRNIDAIYDCPIAKWNYHNGFITIIFGRFQSQFKIISFQIPKGTTKVLCILNIHVQLIRFVIF